MSYDDYFDSDYACLDSSAIEKLIFQILKMKQEIKELNETIQWMHSAIWTELGRSQKLTEEIQHLREILDCRKEKLQ